MSTSSSVRRVTPNSFEAESHYYPRTLNAQLHPLVAHLLAMGPERMVSRYCHLNPKVDREALTQILGYRPKYFPWAGSDLFHVTTEDGRRQMVVIETNSCPSGQKSMPVRDEQDEQGGYRPLVKNMVRDYANGVKSLKGVLAVLYDKNLMEASGYAAAMADEFGEDVYLVHWLSQDKEAPARFVDGVLEIRIAQEWVPVRLAFRYLTQRPWDRLPMCSRSVVLNPVLACIAGGRNKLMAAKAYDFYNGQIAGSGLAIRIPETVRDVGKSEVPLWVQKFGGLAVVKNPYSNAGQGVWTITHEGELEAFMEIEHPYGQFVVQSLIGNYAWSSSGPGGRYYHVGTVPDRHGRIYAADLRFMICAGKEGFRPTAAYARRARVPLLQELEPGAKSWDMLGTNLSVKESDGSWASETSRLLLMDRRDFNKLGLGLDDLLEGYVQTVLAACAIDEMAKRLVTKRGKFRRKLFASLNDDPSLAAELILD